MKKITLLILSCIFVQNSFAAGLLVPSLEAQMKKQEIIDKNRVVIERQIRNQMRIAELRARAKQKIVQTTTPTKSQNQTPVALKPPLQIANQVVPQSSNPTSNTPPPSSQSSIVGVDMNHVRATWLSWYNATRSSLGLAVYTYDSRIDVTAHSWNQIFAASKGQNHHRRNPSDAYYSFATIDAWFMVRGVDPVIINGAKHTENVGYGYYSCNSGDCTDELIDAIRSTYNFYMSEKGKSYDAHYRSIVQPNFSKIGLDIIVIPSEKRYYLTVHYMTR